MSDRIYVGAVDVEIIIDGLGDISDATTTDIGILKPDGTGSHWHAALGTDHESITFTTTLVTDLNQTGEWILQPYLELTSGWEGYCDPVRLMIYEVAAPVV